MSERLDFEKDLIDLLVQYNFIPERKKGLVTGVKMDLKSDNDPENRIKVEFAAVDEPTYEYDSSD